MEIWIGQPRYRPYGVHVRWPLVVLIFCPLHTNTLVRFNTLLDSSKTGLRLKPGVFEKDRNKLGGTIPEFDESSKPFILHSLRRAGKFEGDKLLQEYDKIGQDLDRPDKALLAPYDEWASFVNKVFDVGIPQFSEQLRLIRDHVGEAHKKYLNACGKTSKEGSSKKKKKRRQEPKDTMLAASIKFAEEVQDVDLIPKMNIGEVKASYAYKLSPSFAFAVAFNDLCTIKARASRGGIAPSTRAFDEAKTVSATYLRTVARVDNN